MAEKFVALLPARVRPIVKAAAPFVLNLAYAAGVLITTGEYDATDVRVNAVGLLGALLTYLLPNRK